MLEPIHRSLLNRPINNSTIKNTILVLLLFFLFLISLLAFIYCIFLPPPSIPYYYNQSKPIYYFHPSHDPSHTNKATENGYIGGRCIGDVSDKSNNPDNINRSSNKSSNYFIIGVIDAGSTGTRLAKYKLLLINNKIVGVESEERYELNIPINNFIHNKNELEKYLLLLINNWNIKYNIIFRATAGIRLLNNNKQKWLIDNIKIIFNNYGLNKGNELNHRNNNTETNYGSPNGLDDINDENEDGVAIMTGEKEAEYGWVCINYLKRRFGINQGSHDGFYPTGSTNGHINELISRMGNQPSNELPNQPSNELGNQPPIQFPSKQFNQQPLGSIDFGGASVQIVIPLDSTFTSEIKGEKFIKVENKYYRVMNISLLGIGFSEIRNKMKLYINNSININHTLNNRIKYIFKINYKNNNINLVNNHNFILIRKIISDFMNCNQLFDRNLWDSIDLFNKDNMDDGVRDETYDKESLDNKINDKKINKPIYYCFSSINGIIDDIGFEDSDLHSFDGFYKGIEKLCNSKKGRDGKCFDALIVLYILERLGVENFYTGKHHEGYNISWGLGLAIQSKDCLFR
eukprot:GHVP01036680.1.p1 GENE.GHVP01036680.1~~GHVP01036680.1.p1  ORF type:complete len:574 (-),score=58.97 GHVP01036680.1:536-2257(-)